MSRRNAYYLFYQNPPIESINYCLVNLKFSEEGANVSKMKDTLTKNKIMPNLKKTAPKVSNSKAPKLKVPVPKVVKVKKFKDAGFGGKNRNKLNYKLRREADRKATMESPDFSNLVS